MTCEKYIAYFRRIFFINCYARYAKFCEMSLTL